MTWRVHCLVFLLCYKVEPTRQLEDATRQGKLSTRWMIDCKMDTVEVEAKNKTVNCKSSTNNCGEKLWKDWLLKKKKKSAHTCLPETQSTSHTFRKKIQTGKHTVTTRKVFRDTSRLFTHTPINKTLIHTARIHSHKGQTMNKPKFILWSLAHSSSNCAF